MIGKAVSHYRILEHIGSGGMGIVYKAEDTRLKRTVALKFLPPEFTQDPAARERFFHEAQAASALEHANICSVHELGEHDGQTFLVMGFYEGETLKQKIERGPLAVKEAIDIAIQIGRGLSRAHDAGIVHRDIKPANLIVTTRGEVKILDFGLAKLAGRTQLTRSGSTLGTAAYMSPEQAQGMSVDLRTDIWSLGVVLYEMIAGRLPFSSDYEQGLIYQIINTNPESLTKIRPETPAGLAQILAHALEKQVCDRYATMEEFLEDLAAAADGLTPPTAGVRNDQPEKSIAVLPFINDSPDQENLYFVNGLMEELLNSLQCIRDLRVISRTSVERYRDQRKPIPEIARELGVNYIVEGSAQKYGNAFRLRAQLLTGDREERHLWGGSYQQEVREVKDIFDVQTRIAEAIAGELRAVITPEEATLIARVPTGDLAAYDAYLKGYFHLAKCTKEDIDIALDYFERARGIDPKYALAFAGISSVWLYRQQMGFASPDVAGTNMFDAVQKALALDDTRAEVHCTLAAMKLWGMWDWEGAETAFKKAIELNPNHADAHGMYAQLVLFAGRPDEAMEHARLSLTLDPHNPVLLTWYSYDLYSVRKYRQSLAIADRAVALAEGSAVALAMRFYNLHELSRFPEAGEAFRPMAAANYPPSVLEAYDRDRTQSGYPTALIAAAEALIEESKSTYINPIEIANAFLMAGDTRRGLEYLERAYEAHDPNIIALRQPMYDSLREEPRFRDIARKVGVSPDALS